MRPPKPRITKPRLLWRWKGRWVPIHRIQWTVDGKRKAREVTLDWKNDPQELDRLYWACEAGRHEAQQAPQKYTWGELVKAWRADPRVQGRLSDGTKKSYALDMKALLEKNDGKDVRLTTRKHVRKIHDALSETPRKADKRIAVISLLWNYAREKQDWPLGPNPASGLDLFGPQKQFEPWPEWMVNAEAPLVVRSAIELILGTGQRPNAALTMRWDAFDGERMTVRDEKRDQERVVHCPKELRDYLASIPKRGAYVISRNLNEPLGYNAVEKQFSRWRKDLGEKARPFSMHGLRKLAIVRLAEASWSDTEIQAVTGQSLAMIAYYRERADPFRITKAARERR